MVTTCDEGSRADGDVELMERIMASGTCLAMIVRACLLPERTTFFTPTDYKQQVGYVVYPRGGEVPRHVHRPLERHLVGTSEVILVRRGRCLLDVYDDQRQLVATREVSTGDVMLLVGGGHGFRMLEDTVLLEIKQGPYLGVDDKERF